MAGLRRDVAAHRVAGMDGSSDAPEEDMRGVVERLGNSAAVGGYYAGGPLAVAAPASSSKGSDGFQE